MSRWSTADIPDQTGRTFVITGANAGLGLQSTRALTDAGARVVMACRDAARAEAARAALPHPERAAGASLDLEGRGSGRAAGVSLGGARPAGRSNNAGRMDSPRAGHAPGHG